jgi:hypothetical protein
MNKAAVMGLALAVTLSGCGGGGGSSATTAALATSVPRVVATAGDYFTYNVTVTPTGQSAINSTVTRAYPTVNGDGSGTRIDTYSTPSARSNLTYDALFGTTGYTVGSTGSTTCTDSPSLIIIPVPATTSTSWNNNSTQTCTGLSPSTITLNVSGSLTAFESVVTPAGTFYAGKVSYTETETQTGVFTEVLNFTCWVDTVTGRLVKCNATYTYTPNSGTAITGSETVTLAGYSAASLSSVPTVARFAGTWTGSYSGTSSGSCSNLVVNTAGSISGSCSDINVGAFTVTGTVNVNGTINMTASTGATFTGTLSSTINGSGTWIGAPSGGGSWTAAHQ